MLCVPPPTCQPVAACSLSDMSCSCGTVSSLSWGNVGQQVCVHTNEVTAWVGSRQTHSGDGAGSSTLLQCSDNESDGPSKVLNSPHLHKYKHRSLA